jgi:hypothetical protein
MNGMGFLLFPVVLTLIGCNLGPSVDIPTRRKSLYGIPVKTSGPDGKQQAACFGLLGYAAAKPNNHLFSGGNADPYECTISAMVSLS